ncbi:potassium-transporting ATPase subunit KdpC [Microlunatus parietis]|uniref:Potassium-transporting ATPase KdpC subunit n=1 Tax=Microlunatus parietis TaxID=682979 RepID=A0A7Y9IEW0_9ACTN|nr:potassium-transporting ATPase subunit KdpC [Microlunatus parietis]NYE75564.1 K+-transporting ATPase ATPase C chain [Microlunatus parietis]
MNARFPNFVRQLLTGLRAVAVLTVVLGVAYPVAVWLIGFTMPYRAAGSLITENGQVVGSALIGQSFEGDQWFQPRPSAGDYDALASGGSNAGPNDADLIAAIQERRAAVAKANGVPESAVPPDAVTASASGLEPYISPEYAAIQVNRVATARDLPVADVQRLVAAHTEGRMLGFLGERRVNVVSLNQALGAD